MFFDFLAIHLNGPHAADKHYAFNLIFRDTKENYALTVQNGVMNYGKGKTLSNPDATITLDRSTLDDIALGKLEVGNLADSGQVKFEGDRQKFKEMLGLLDKFDFWFPISEP
jgi:alkyl sulfatase BDS1-like metallo-beta-lactamase superfamily hydrolase